LPGRVARRNPLEPDKEQLSMKKEEIFMKRHTAVVNYQFGKKGREFRDAVPGKGSSPRVVVEISH